MIPRECKRLAEVEFPIAEVSRHAAREKSIRHGHPSTLHLWWARRPLASSRAVLLALLLPDPCDPACPAEFKTQARTLLARVQGTAAKTDQALQSALLRFIGAFANWDLAAEPTYLEVSRGLVRAAHGDEAPLVVDPFAGGGSISLEALRLGCDTFASDLNPVACLILKVMLEDIPRHGPELAEELRRVGAEIKHEAEKELAELYPSDPDGARPIAYLWARTVRCESPNCGAEIPLMRSFWLSKKANRRRALRTKVMRVEGVAPQIQFEIFEPKTEKEVAPGTVARAKATCLACGSVLPPERVRAQLVVQRGGADTIFDDQGQRTGGARLLAVVTLREDAQGRQYRVATARDYEAVRKAQKRVARPVPEDGSARHQTAVPSEPLHADDLRNFAVARFGVVQFGQMFTSRQGVALSSLTERVRDLAMRGRTGSLRRLMAVVVDRGADYNSAGTRWVAHGEFIGNTFTRQSLSMVWDFAEVNPFADATGGLKGAIEWVGNVIERAVVSQPGQTQRSDAVAHPLADGSASVWFTDPPYYDAVPYADLSDFFYVWLKRTLPDEAEFRSEDSEGLTPKVDEAVQNVRSVARNGRPKDRAFYEDAMARAFAEGRRVLRDDGIGAVVFAHKTTEGWEALLSGMIRGGWTITGSWPIATEMGSRLRARDSAALATSVHLICRPRPDDAPVGDWSTVLAELPPRVTAWMERLEGEGVRGADLVFACIGPALEIYSRYRKVETAAGEDVPLDAYLEKVWEVVGRSALENVLGAGEARARNGVAGALEEDARLTALFLWTIEATATGDDGESEEATDEAGDEEDDTDAARPSKGFSLVHDVVRRFAQPLGIELSRWEGRVIKTEKGVVRLLAVAERARQLFGEDGADAVATRIEHELPGAGAASLQGMLFPTNEQPRPRGRARPTRARVEVPDEGLAASYRATTLDRVHVAMLLQASGRANALRTLLRSEQERGPDFLRLANALSALYPRASEEKRLLDAMLLAMPR